LFNLTKQEKLVILFLLAALVVGAAAVHFKDAINGFLSKPQAPAGEASFQTQAPRIININTAGEKELASLPKIGPKMAKKIIEYRQTVGPFLLKEDLKKVKGISQKIYKLLESRITTQ